MVRACSNSFVVYNIQYVHKTHSVAELSGLSPKHSVKSKECEYEVFFFLLMNGSDETSAKSFFSVLRFLWRGWFHAACPNLISYKIYISNGNGHCCYTRCCQSGNTLAKMLYHSFSRTWFHRCPHWQPMGGECEWCMLVERYMSSCVFVSVLPSLFVPTSSRRHSFAVPCRTLW